MSKMQREKGRRFEQKLARILCDNGYDARRTAQYCGKTGDASDVVGLPRIHIEAKHVEAMRLYDWIEQAARDAEKSGLMPAVFHKKNNARILVTMYLEDWLEIYREFEAGIQIREV